MTYGFSNIVRDWLLALAILGSLLALLILSAAVEWGRAHADAARVRRRRSQLASHRGTGSHLVDVRHVRRGVEGVGVADVAHSSAMDERASAVALAVASAEMDMAEDRLRRH